MALKRFIIADFERKAQAVMTVDIVGMADAAGVAVYKLPPKWAQKEN